MGGINIRPMDPALLSKCMRLVAQLREEDQDARAARESRDYAAQRAARHPWISLPEAAIELDVSQGRISQLISSGQLTVRKHPDGGAKKQVLAADVFNIKTEPHKKPKTRTRAA